MLVTHQVADFDTWNIEFDSHESVRVDVGIKATPYKEIGGNPNQVHIIGTVRPKEDLESGFSEPEMHKVMKNARVISKPEMTFLEES